MALSISCCLNLPPPQSNTASTSESLRSKTSHLAWPKSQRQRSRKNRCLLGVATIIVGLEMISLEGISEQQMALAWDVQQETPASKPLMEVRRWSDKRMCPPWRVNSLETIVPENLPRPFARRRWEAVKFPDASSQSYAQITAKIVTAPKGCFSL